MQQQKRWTTPLELTAYIIAHVIGIVLVTVESALFMGHVYGYVAKTYGYSSVALLGFAHSLVTMLVVLVLFLALRVAMMGGLPRPQDAAAGVFD